MDTSKIIKGAVSSGRYTVTAPIVKEDYGLYLQIEGVELPSTYQVDFSNSEHSGTSVTMIGNSDGVLIPHQFIDTGKDVFAFLYHVGANYGRTVYKFRIPNKVRPDRTEEQPTPEEQSTIDQAISALNTAVEQTAQDVIDADASAQSASQSAENAHDSAVDAQNYAESAQTSATQASASASQASASATASAQSASQSAQIKADVEDLADDAQGYAQASAQSASASANSASQAQGFAQSASASANSASGYASQAQTSAQTASSKASEASQSASQASGYAQTAETAKTDAQTAKTQAETARDEAVTAKTAAETAQGKAEDAQAAAESVAESIPSDYSQLSEDVSDLKEDFSDIAVELIPTNYGSVSTENLIIGTSGLSGKVTASDTDDGVSLINTAGVNGTVGFELAELPYGSSIPLDFVVTVTNAVTPINIDIMRGVTSGNSGVVISSLALSDGVYKLENWIPSTFDHDTYGNIFLGYNLRYNQRSPVEITLSVKRHGAVQKTVIKNSALENIDYDNLSSELKDAITIVSGNKPTEYGGKQICTFNKGVVIGDSLTAGAFNYSGGATTIPSFSFPAKLAQLSGIDMTNLGNGGASSVQWYSNHSTDDLSGYQFAIIQLGVNDAMQYNGWTQDSIDAFTNIINKLLEENNGIFVFVSTIIPATSYMGEKYNAVSEGIRNLVETLNNNHVILLDMAQYAHTGDAVGYNNGHLSALGYERLALDYISYISYVISQNLTLFRNIQFIGTNYTYS